MPWSGHQRCRPLDKLDLQWEELGWGAKSAGSEASPVFP